MKELLIATLQVCRLVEEYFEAMADMGESLPSSVPEGTGLYVRHEKLDQLFIEITEALEHVRTLQRRIAESN